jgi:hypothetical protein
MNQTTAAPIKKIAPTIRPSPALIDVLSENNPVNDGSYQLVRPAMANPILIAVLKGLFFSTIHPSGCSRLSA